jgi:uncharacterized protein (DUF924 family)
MERAVQEILVVWFGEVSQRRREWFVKNPAFDQEVRSRFLDVYHHATLNQLDDWVETPESALALVLVFDQFPRNMFRGQPQSFATDSKALTVAETAIEHGFDQQLPSIQRFFFYLPFEHSEKLEHQNRSVQLFEQFIGDPELQDTYDYALRHRAVIEQFGRFPHRNEILGRPSTPEEIEFLKQPGSSF